MEHLGTKRIETTRLILRPFEIEDAPFMYKNWASDSDVTQFLTWPAHSSIEDSKAVLNNWISNYEKKDYYHWAIVLKAINEPIGGISIVKQRDDIRMVQVGYCIGRNWWNQGITSEAFKALIHFFIDEVGVNRIEAWHDTRNPNSGKVMLKCGLKYEGTMKQVDKNNQGICDCAIYGLIEEEYRTTLADDYRSNIINYEATLHSAKEYGDIGKIEEWVHSFLCKEGNNKAFSDGLKKEEREYSKPVLMPLELFERCCGPEQGIKYQVDPVAFNLRVDAIMNKYKTGNWDMPPIIVNYNNGIYELNDGNHRFEALKRLGIKEYWVIIWKTV